MEQLAVSPLHLHKFSEIFDTAYFGKSHYSKLIQIADLLAGTFRYYFAQMRAGKTSETDYWTQRIAEIIEKITPNIIHKECFKGTELVDIYKGFEINL